MAHQIMSFTDSQNEKLAADIQLGTNILHSFARESGKLNAKTLDQAFLNWARQPEQFSNEDIANGLGAILGELIKQDFGFSWKMVEDGLGCEAALLDEISGSIVFPVNSVWKRLDPEVLTEPFFEPMYNAIKIHLEKQKQR